MPRIDTEAAKIRPTTGVNKKSAKTNVSRTKVFERVSLATAMSALRLTSCDFAGDRSWTLLDEQVPTFETERYAEERRDG